MMSSIQKKQLMKNYTPLRFIGSKSNLLLPIQKIIEQHCGKNINKICGDLFCGTAAVSKHFKKLGYSVVANDNLVFCSLLAKATLLINEEPKFVKLIESKEIPTNSLGKILAIPYDHVLEYLNKLSGTAGFIYNEYSPTKGDKIYQRKYFAEKNAKKIDSIREKINKWQIDNLITDAESALLISDLIRATNKVANIAGTYGYFLKEWDPRAEKDLVLRRSEIIPSNKQHLVYQEDANELVKRIKCDILYLDPPYTWRHYGAYYHILETIARWDNPKVKGLSGLRPWEDSKSRYCYRNDALNALQELVENSNANHIFLSYSNDGMISHEQICKILESFERPKIHEIKYRRYKSSNGIKENVVMERIYYVKK